MTASIVSIIEFDYNKDDGVGMITAVIDDVVLVSPATQIDPEEYGPALAFAYFSLEDDVTIPTDTAEQEIFFEELNLDWEQTNDYE